MKNRVKYFFGKKGISESPPAKKAAPGSLLERGME
jgi:hypothetical protein